MIGEQQTVSSVRGYCALCISRCGSVARLENGRFVALEPDPSHPTGQALCAKGRAAPELVYHPDRLLYPLKRTHPKGAADPGWQRIEWDEALDLIAGKLRQIAAESGPHSVVFSMASQSTSALVDSNIWILRLMHAFGSPNLCGSMELCGWGRAYATGFTFGTGMGLPGTPMPDLDNAGCILFWGYNPSLSRLSHATATVQALKRGARLIVVDPRRVGLAARADVWLRVRPGTDAALALGIANVMIEHGWFDHGFVRDWTNGPLLVRTDTGRMLTEGDLSRDGNAWRLFAWDAVAGKLIGYDQSRRQYERDGAERALLGTFVVSTLQGEVKCRPAFEVCAEAARSHSLEAVKSITGIDGREVERAARLLWDARPVAFYAWSGVEQQTSSTQIFRAMSFLYALTGSYDVRGGNVLFPAIPSNNVAGLELSSPPQRARSLGLAQRPLGPSVGEWVTTDEVYRAIVDHDPYPVRGLVGFGANLLLAHADVRRGREALAKLDFYAHADLFMNPTAELADVVLPIASPFERHGLKIGFEVSEAAQSLVQLRQPVAQPRGEARSDTEFVFNLACRLGLGEHFWNGDVDAAYSHQLEPSGVTLEELRQNPAGVRVPLETRYRKFAEIDSGSPRGFATPSGLVELYSETLLEHGYPAVPEFCEPLVSPRSRPDLGRRYPLILTCAKNTQFCETQHRGLPSLRRKVPDPEVELHPATAAARGIRVRDWVLVESPDGAMRARARFNDALDPDVVCGEHGWWQACSEIGAPGYDAFSAAGSNYNLLIGNAAIDPTGGSVPHRAYICQVRRAD
ncbi:MAG: molybdopterin-dependent oxidoreductase [Chloroflexi bacterium]|nr:molybdopterin-dependent oxidoreductase [Chloroflexota bacterium]